MTLRIAVHLAWSKSVAALRRNGLMRRNSPTTVSPNLWGNS